jgi:2-polyprenyl-6-methoxyphenol hydroxylase-like FAD-dependent oxidoreductase
MDTARQDVVVVGAGPVGLALGAELRRLGTSSVTILDRQEGEKTLRVPVWFRRAR